MRNSFFSTKFLNLITALILCSQVVFSLSPQQKLRVDVTNNAQLKDVAFSKKVVRFLADDHDHDHDDHDDDHDDEITGKKWGQMIGATLFVNFMTFAGVFIFGAQAMCGKDAGLGFLNDIAIPSFAAGALLGTAVFIVLPESFHLIEGGHGDEHGDEHDDHRRTLVERRTDEEDRNGTTNDDNEEHEDHGDEAELAWKWGTSLLGGFLFPLLMSTFSSRPDKNKETNKKDTNNVEDTKDGKDIEVLTTNPDDVPEVDWKLCSAVLIGDAFHNIADGTFIATAFKLCSTSMALGIMGITVYHEFVQELADYLVLTTQGGMGVAKALIYNFLSGLSVVLGGLLVFALDPNEEALGCLLAISGGVYIYIAASECIPRAEKNIKSTLDGLKSFAMIALGVIPLGLVLLNHEHCDAGH